MSPSIRLPEPSSSKDRAPNQSRRIPARAANGESDLYQSLDQRVSALTAAVNGLRSHLEATASQSSKLEQALSVLMNGLSSWKREANEAASRAERRLLGSVEALEARLSQHQLKEPRIKEIFGEAAASLLQAVEQGQAEASSRAGKSEERIQQGIDSLAASVEEYRAQVEVATESLSGMMSGISAIEERIHRLEVAASEPPKQLEKIENTLLGELKDLERQASEARYSEAENWERLLRSLELLDERFSEKQQAKFERLESVVLAVSPELEAWKAEAQLAAKEAQDQWLIGLREIDTKLSDKLEEVERRASEARQMSSENLERLENSLSGKLDELERRASETRQVESESRERLENRLAGKLDELERRASETRQVESENRERLLRALELLDARFSEKQQVVSEALKSALSSVPVKLNEWQAENQRVTKEAEGQWLIRLEEIESRISGKLDELERKAYETQRMEAENREGLVRGLELLESWFSEKQQAMFERLESAVFAVPEKLEELDKKASYAQRVETEKWERLLRGLELLDDRFSEKQQAMSERLQSAVSSLASTAQHQAETATDIEMAVNALSNAVKQWKAEVQQREETMVALILGGGFPGLQVEAEQPPTT